MDIREFYERTGGSYTDVMGRLMKESRVEKFVRMFLQDPCFGELETCLARKDYAGAFRAVHTLKGVCLNLSFSRLYESVYQVTEVLRKAELDSGEDQEKIAACMEVLRSDYREIIEGIQNLDTNIS